MKNNVSFPTAVLFDFDGVIVDSFQSHYKAWESAFIELFGFQELNFPHKELAGKSPVLIAEYICNQIGEPGRGMEFFKLKAEHLHRGDLPPTLLPGVKEIQQFLEKLNIPHGIASNATRMFLQNSIQQLDLGFTTFFGIEDYTYPKPHPEAYLTLATNLGIAEKDYSTTWIFEDSITGTQSAKDAGMVPIGILTLNDEEKMRAAGSQLVFPTLLEAFHYLQKLKKPITN